MKKYEFLLADADDTLLDFHRAEYSAISLLFRKYGTEPTEELINAYSEHNDRLWKRLEKNELTISQLMDVRFTEFFNAHGIKGDGIEAAGKYLKILSGFAYKIDGSQELLERCRGKIKVYIISNGKTEVQGSRLVLSGFDKLTDGVFLSERIGYKKPERKFFEAVALSVPGFDPDRALVYGDSLSADIAGGINYGVDTCWFNPNRKKNLYGLKPTYEIRSHKELYAILNI